MMIAVSVDQELKARIEEEALRTGRSVSNYIRYIILKEIGEKHG